MADHNDTVIIELDRPRELRLGHLALKRFTAQVRVPMAELGDVIQDYDMLVKLLLTMLQVDDPGLTEEALDIMLDRKPLGYIIGKVSEAISAAFDTGEDGQDENPPSGTGATV